MAQNPLMPKATAVWLIDNTALTFQQIADYCQIHVLEVQAIADGEVATNIVGQSPITLGQLTQEEITKCEKNPKLKLKMAKTDLPAVATKVKGPKYTPLAKRVDKPDAIAFIVKNYPEIPDHAICKLIGTTKPTIEAIRSKSHWNSSHITPHNPVHLGICSLVEWQNFIEKYAHPEEESATEEE